MARKKSMKKNSGAKEKIEKPVDKKSVEIPKTKKKKFRVVFVCTGNTCRSPMAEALFKAFLKERGEKNIEVKSAGLYAQTGDLIAENAVGALNVLNVECDKTRKAKPLTMGLSLADLVVGMSEAHAEKCGKNATSIERLTGRAVADPYGGTLGEYLETAAQIRDALPAVYDEALKRMKN